MWPYAFQESLLIHAYIYIGLCAITLIAILFPFIIQKSMHFYYAIKWSKSVLVYVWRWKRWRMMCSLTRPARLSSLWLSPPSSTHTATPTNIPPRLHSKSSITHARELRAHTHSKMLGCRHANTRACSAYTNDLI